MGYTRTQIAQQARLIKISARQQSDYRSRFETVAANQAFESGSSFLSSGTFLGVAAAPELV